MYVCVVVWVREFNCMWVVHDYVGCVCMYICAYVIVCMGVCVCGCVRECYAFMHVLVCVCVCVLNVGVFNMHVCIVYA